MTDLEPGGGGGTRTEPEASEASIAADAPGWFEAPGSTSPASTEGASYLDAIAAALEDELATDERVVLLGEDIAQMGGAFRVTAGLLERHGERRVIDTPMSEAAIVGAAIGMAVAGMRPIAELQFADFVSCAYDQLVTEAAKLHYRFGIPVPMVVRAPSGGGIGAGPFHSQSPEGVFAHIPGLKVVCPGTVQDAYDLLRAAVGDPNPVLYFEHKRLYRSLRGELVRRAVSEPLGRAAVRRAGSHLTLVTYGGMVSRCLDVAERLAEAGKDIEVIDLRTVLPLDMQTVIASVQRTSRVVIVHEDTYSSGVGAEVAARLATDALYDLDAPIIRVAAPDAPFPFAAPLEEAYVPSAERISAAVIDCLAR